MARPRCTHENQDSTDVQNPGFKRHLKVSPGRLAWNHPLLMDCHRAVVIRRIPGQEGRAQAILIFFVLISRSLTQTGVPDMGRPETSPSRLQVRSLYKNYFRLSITAFIPPREADHCPPRSELACGWYLARLLFRICLCGILRIVVIWHREYLCTAC